MKNLAIIKARGGSTRIPKKNIVSFLGSPLMARVIKACKEAGIFDRILVATDDDEIIKKNGKEIILRPRIFQNFLLSAARFFIEHIAKKTPEISDTSCRSFRQACI